MRSTALVVLLLGVATLAPSKKVNAASGDLDPAFGVEGRARAAFGDSGGAVIARQSDGKLVAAGAAGTFETADIAVARFDTNGVLDPTFNGTGQVTTSIGPFHDGASQVLIQSDGKIVVVGTTDTAADGSTGAVVVVRYNADGTLDGGFGTAGIVTTSVSSGTDGALAGALQSDDKLVVVGGTSGATFDELVIRYDTDGTLDATFGTGGVVTLDFGGRGDQARDVLVQPDGDIVVAGTSFNGPLFLDGAVATLTRLDGNGALDPSFGTGGSVVFSPQPINLFNNVVRQTDGKLVVLGATGPGAVGFQLFRFDAAGAPDGGFAGTYIPFFITNINADALALAPDGKFIVSGFFVSGFQSARANADGTLDTTYGNGGSINDIIGASSVSIGALVEPSSDIVVVGSSQLEPGPTYEMTVARIIGTSPACTSDSDCGLCERCGGGGTCEIGARSGCAVAATKAAKLGVDSKGIAKSALALSWKGAVPAVDPVTADDIGVCLFQGGQRRFKAVAPAGGTCGADPCWTGSFATKLAYKDAAGTPHGIRKADISGKKIIVKAKGLELATSPQGLPDPSSLGPNAPPVVLQVQGGNGACATATFSAMRRARSGKFTGKSD